MQDVFTLVGVVCSLLICATLLLVAINAYRHNEAVAYYNGIRREISDMMSDLRKTYADDEPISAGKVRLILGHLHGRYYMSQQDLEDIKCNDFQFIRAQPSNGG